MLAALAVVDHGDYHETNAIKNMVAFLIQAIASVVLIGGGLVHWPHAIVTIVAASVGGYFGVSVARRAPVTMIRAAVVAVGAALTVLFFLK